MADILHELPDFQDLATAFAFQSSHDLQRSLFLFRSMQYPFLIRMGAPWMTLAIKAPGVLRTLIKDMFFAHFFGGESLEEAEQVCKKLASYQVGSVLDYAIEGGQSDAALEHTVQETLAAIRFASSESGRFAVFKVSGIAPSALLEKQSAGQALSTEEQTEWRRIEARIERLCHETSQCGSSLLIDAEESWIQPAIDSLAEKSMRNFNQKKTVIYHTIQMYRHDRLHYLERLIRQSEEEGWKPGIKLVRGAYLEKERLRAVRLGYPSPLYPDKASTDHAYDQALEHCLNHRNQMALFAGTHNEASCLKLCQMMIHQKIPADDRQVIFSQLMGMGDHLTFNLARAGFPVAKYVPYGPLTESLPYLMRRAEENSSVRGQASRELRLTRQELRRRRQELRRQRQENRRDRTVST
ncbi:MAG: proline dehydrogenase family protein [Deltaproteobacteria bacterium]|nr:proline dehydrogenase family protein [Deltaproteobacteria bacterium]